MRKFYLLPVSFLAVMSHANAQSLSESVLTAINNHPQIQISKLAVDTADHDIDENRSAYFPTVSLDAKGGRLFGDNSTSRGLSVTRGEGYSYLWEGSVTGTQSIWDWNETSNRVDAARASKKAAGLELADIRDQVALQVVQTYVNLVRAEAGYKMVKLYRSQVQDYIKRIENMVEQGAADEAELQQARDILIFLQNFEADYKGQKTVAASDYRELVGAAPAENLSLPTMSFDMIHEDVEDAIVAAKQVHPGIQAAALYAQAGKHEIAAEKSAYYPDIDGELSYTKTDKRDLIGGESEDARALLRMRWEFETGGALAARVSKKRIEQETAKARVREIERSAERQVRFAYAEHEVALSQWDNQKRRKALNQKLFHTYKTQFEGAVVSLLQLMQADNQLFNARLEEMNARHRYILAQYGVLASTGQLQAALGLRSHDEPEKQ